MKKPVSLNIGDRVGRLIITGPIYTENGKRYFSMARCDCGKEWLADRAAIRAGRIKSCGCLAMDAWAAARTKHGESSRAHKTPEYSVWLSMRNRCRNPKSINYAHYGARGIQVCAEWDSFETFRRDMGRRPKGQELDRIDNDLGYQPDNCRWTTRHHQMRNTQMTKMVTLNGREMCVTDAAAAMGIPADRIFGRVYRDRISHQEALDRILSRR